ncbi:MAG: MFS transporter [bacterium JZ-2024 1]
MRAIYYGIGGMGITVASYGFMQWAQYLYSPPEGSGWAPILPVAVFGYATLWGRVVDALSNLFLPYLSDRGLPLLGRRKGFILLGSLICGISAFILFSLNYFSTHLSIPSSLLITTIFLLFGLYFLSFTMATAPYLALLADITSQPQERTRYALTYAFFTFLGVLFAFVAGANLVEKKLFYILGIVFALATALPLIITALTIGEPENPSPLFSPLLPAIRGSLSASPFRILVLTNVLWWGGLTIFLSLLPYMNKVWWKLSDVQLQWYGLAIVVSAAVFLPVNFLFVRRFGKKRVYASGLFSFGILSFTLSFLHFLPAGFFYPVSFLIFILVGFNVGIMVGIPNAVLADFAQKLASEGESKTATLFGLNGFFTKIGQGVSILISTGILNTFGYTQAHFLGLSLSHYFGAFLFLLASLIFSRYPEKK